MSNIFYDYHLKDDVSNQKDREYSRILTAAIVNQNFRKLLLANPSSAIKKGFAGEAFSLPREDANRIAAIRASTLADFARQMTCSPVFAQAPGGSD